MTTSLFHLLIDFALFGGLVLLAGCLALACFKQPIDRLRIIEWTLAGCLVAPLLQQIPGMPRWSLGLWPRAEAETAEPNAEPPSPAIDPAANSSADFAANMPQRPMPQAAPPLDLSAMPPAPAEPPASPAAPAWNWSWPAAIVATFAVGLVCMAAWLAFGFVALYLVSRRSQPATGRAQEIFTAIAGNDLQKIRLGIAHRLSSPVAAGLLRPKILLPTTLTQTASDAELRFCLAHELSHLRHGDLWRWQLCSLASLLFFYQPLYWHLRRQLRLAQDYLADHFAAQTADPTDYASFLIKLAHHRLGLLTITGLTISDSKSNLFQRVTMLLNNESLSFHRKRSWNVVVGIIGVALIGLISVMQLGAEEKPAEQPNPAEISTEQSKSKIDQPELHIGAKSDSITYTGTVLDKDTANPIPGAAVSVRLMKDVYERGRGTCERHYKTDAAGEFTFTIPPELVSEHHAYSFIRIQHPNYTRGSDGKIIDVAPAPGQPAARRFPQPIVLPRGKAVTGVVTMPDGKPAAKVFVRGYSEFSPNADQQTSEFNKVDVTQTDDEGRFRLMMVEHGPAIFWILPDKNFAPSRHLIGEQRGDVGAFKLQRGQSITGKLVDINGKPVPGVYLYAHSNRRIQGFSTPLTDQMSRWAISDAKGEFKIEPLPAGTYLLETTDEYFPTSEDRTTWPPRHVPPAVFLPIEVNLIDGQPTVPVELRAVPDVLIEAQAIDSQGRPRSDIRAGINGLLDNKSFRPRAEITPQGKIIARTPRGMKAVLMTVLADPNTSLRWRLSKDKPWQTGNVIELGPVGDGISGIEITCYRAPTALVKVVDQKGQTRQETDVTAFYAKGVLPSSTITPKRNWLTDVAFDERSKGAFRSICLLPDEELTITAYADGLASSPTKLRLAEGEEKEITLTLDKATAGEGPISPANQGLILKVEAVDENEAAKPKPDQNPPAKNNAEPQPRPTDKSPPSNTNQSKASSTEGQSDNKLIIAGLDLSQAPSTDDYKTIPDLYQQETKQPGYLHLLGEIFEMPLATGDDATSAQLKYAVDRRRYYIQYRSKKDDPKTERTYGPFPGDPFERFQLDERFLAQMEGNTFGTLYPNDPYFRVRLMLRTDNAALVEKSLRFLMKELDRPTPLYYKAEHLTDVDHILEKYSATLKKHNQAAAVETIQQKVAAIKQEIEAATIEIPDWQYTAQDADAAQVTQPIPATAWGKSNNGLRLAAVPEPDSVAIGERIRFLLVVENTSDHDIKFSLGDLIHGFHPEVQTADGKPVEIKSPWASGWNDQRFYYRLHPGQQTILTAPSIAIVDKSSSRAQPAHTTIVLSDEQKQRSNIFKVRYTANLLGGSWRQNPAGQMLRTSPAKGEWSGTLTSGAMAINATREKESQKSTENTEKPKPTANNRANAARRSPHNRA